MVTPQIIRTNIFLSPGEKRRDSAVRTGDNFGGDFSYLPSSLVVVEVHEFATAFSRFA